MPDAMRVPVAPMGLSEIAEEFKRLDNRRRSQGLSMGEAERYNALFARLSDVLASNERHRRVDVRQFLRVKFRMELVVRTSGGELLATCADFGGGGCSVTCPALFHLGDDVWLDGAIIEGQRLLLHGRSVVAWARLPSAGSAQHGYGLRFAIDSPRMRDQIDRVLYRVLDLFLNDGRTGPHRKIALP
jgi:hypothetical protein